MQQYIQNTHKILSGMVVGLLLATLCACGNNEPSPLIIGKLDTVSLRNALGVAGLGQAASGLREVTIAIDGDERDISLEDDLTFVVQDLPTGEVVFDVAIEGIIGTLTIFDVVPGEVIDIEVVAGIGYLEIVVVRREEPEPESPTEWDDEFLEISGDYAVYHLDGGTYEGDIVISGDYVTLAGPSNCDTVLLGDLIILGNYARIVNVEVWGTTDIQGDYADIYTACHGGDDDDDDDDDDD